MSKKVLKTIKVSTLPNGYSLTVGNSEFMYFSEIDLLAGFLSHVGSGKTDDMEKGDILNTLFNVMLGDKYVRDVDNLNKTVERLERKYNERIEKLEKLITIVNDAVNRHATMKEQLEETTKLTDIMREGYSKALKPFKEYDQRINKLEIDTQRMESHFNTATNQADNLLKYIEERLSEVNKDENLLKEKAQMLVEKLDMRLKMFDEVFDVDKKAAGMPVDDIPEVEASNSKAQEKKPRKKAEKKPKADKPTKTVNPKGKTTRQKRDEAILAKMNDNPNIK